MCSHWTRPTSRRPTRRAARDTNVKKPKPKIVRTGGQTFQQLSELERKQTENVNTGEYRKSLEREKQKKEKAETGKIAELKLRV